MNLSSVASAVKKKLGHQKEEPVENFLALKVGLKSLTAAPWTIRSGKVVVGTAAIVGRTSQTLEDLVLVADEVISKVSVGVEPEPKKIIFGVHEDWVDEGKIKSNFLSDLRHLCKKLELTPMGFVTMSEAVENFLKEIEGVPVTAVLVGIDHGKVLVTMLRAGKNFGSFSEAMSPDIAASLEKAIRRFTDIEFLPSRIIIYDGKSDLEDWKQKIVAYPWTQRLPFLHFPKVEALTAEEVARAVAIAGGTQLGGKLDPLSIETEKEEKEEPVFSGDELREVDPSELGFITETEQSGLADMPSSPGIPGNLPKRNLSFSPAIYKAKSFVKKLSWSSSSFLTNISKIKPSGRMPSVLAVSLLVLVIVILVGGGAALYFVPKAVLTVYVDPRVIEKKMDIVVSLSSATSSSSATISGKTIESTLTGTKRGVVTGKKLVGQKAHGTITIFSSSTGRDFVAGTTLSDPTGDLKFTLDNQVSVATGDAISAATVTASITAADIGDKYNLPAGTKFSIGSLSTSYLAKNDSALAGGNSHQATVVTREDQSRLLASASAELEGRAKEELKTKLSGGETLLDKAITSGIETRKFSREVDTEADNITLDLSLKFTGVVFDQQQAGRVFRDKIASEIPADYELPLDRIKGDLIKVTPLKNGDYILNMDFLATALPVVSPADLSAKTAGKTVAEAINIARSGSGVESAQVSISPKILAGLKRMPWQRSQIRVEIVSR